MFFENWNFKECLSSVQKIALETFMKKIGLEIANKKFWKYKIFMKITKLLKTFNAQLKEFCFLELGMLESAYFGFKRGIHSEKKLWKK